MSELLSKEIRAKVDALSKSIAVAHELDSEIQTELANHMEDKLLGYATGQERLSEEDAFILMREHFGKPSVIKSLLQNVHRDALHLSLARRLSAAAAVHFVFLAAMGFTAPITVIFSTWFQLTHGGSGPYGPLNTSVNVAIIVIGTYVFWRVLLHWRDQLRSGGQPWFQRWRGTQIGILLCLLIFLQLFIPTSSTNYHANVEIDYSTSSLVNILVFIIAITCFVSLAVAWLWWSDTNPRTPRTLSIAGLAWLAMAGLPWSFLRLLSLDIHIFDTSITTNPETSGGLMLWRMSDGGYTAICVLRLWPSSALSIWSVGITFAAAVFIIAFAKFFYTQLVRFYPDISGPKAAA